MAALINPRGIEVKHGDVDKLIIGAGAIKAYGALPRNVVLKFLNLSKYERRHWSSKPADATSMSSLLQIDDSIPSV